MHILFYLFLLCFYGSIGCGSCSGQPLALILREGEGEIGPKGPIKTDKWPEGFFLKAGADKPYRIVRVEQEKYLQPDPRNLDTWNPSRFTSLKGLKEGTALDHFQFIVHGLEIADLVPILDYSDCAFDRFVRRRLNAGSPIGIDFTTLYAYFFHKKTVVAVSAISENLTTIFGQVGFILNVPQANILMAGPMDICSPHDDLFYTPAFPGAPYTSKGDVDMEIGTSWHGLPPLESILPQRASPIQDILRPYIYQEPADTDRMMRSLLQSEGKPDIYTSQPPHVKKGIKDLHRQDKLGRQPFSSWYNEATVNPVRTYTDKPSSNVTIVGAFLRTSAEQLGSFRERPEVQRLWAVAEAFDLPVVFINDGRNYTPSLEEQHEAVESSPRLEEIVKKISGSSLAK